VVVDDISSQSATVHGVEDELVEDVVANTHDLAIEACLDIVDVPTSSESDRHHESYNVDQHRLGMAACKSLDDVWFGVTNPPSQYLDVLINLLMG
jgi:hypothetical protein